MKELLVNVDEKKKYVNIEDQFYGRICATFDSWESLNDFVVDLKMAGLKVFGPEDLYENKPKYKFFDKSNK